MNKDATKHVISTRIKRKKQKNDYETDTMQVISRPTALLHGLHCIVTRHWKVKNGCCTNQIIKLLQKNDVILWIKMVKKAKKQVTLCNNAKTDE